MTKLDTQMKKLTSHWKFKKNENIVVLLREKFKDNSDSKIICKESFRKYWKDNSSLEQNKSNITSNVF